MNKLTLFITLLLCSCSSKAQQIVYDFPKPVVEKVLTYVEKTPLENGNIYVLELAVGDNGQYRLSMLDIKKDTSDIIYNVLVKNTSRFAKIGTSMIPVLSAEDFTFADFGTVYDPNNKNPKRRVGKRKIVRSFDGYSITFDQSGKIY